MQQRDYKMWVGLCDGDEAVAAAYFANPMLRQYVEGILETIRAARAPNTRRTYRIQWEAWDRWAAAHGEPSLPASPTAVATYAHWLAREGRAVSSIRVAMSAITLAHHEAGLQVPTAHPQVRLLLAGIKRVFKKTVKQAKPIDAEALAAIRNTACEPRPGANRWRKLESEENARRRGLVDIALVALMTDAGLRRSEAAVLTWSCIRVADDGSGRVFIKYSKTDTLGKGSMTACTEQTMRDLQAIKPENAGADDSVFSLSESQINRRIKAAAKQAGLGDGYSGHSPRVGMAVRMSENGAPAHAIAIQGRWASLDQVKLYTRSTAIVSNLRYLNMGDDEEKEDTEAHQREKEARQDDYSKTLWFDDAQRLRQRQRARKRRRDKEETK